MKKFITILLAALLIISAVFALGSCSKKDSDNVNKETEEKTEDNTSTTENSEASEDGDKDADAETEFNPEDIEKTITPDAEDVIGDNLPMQIESVVLFKDGSIQIVPTDDLKKNELADSKATSIAPFAESGKAKDIYLCRLGNEGYRVILALMDDGSISAVNVLSLMKDHIFVVIDNVAGRDNFTGIEEVDSEDEDEGGYSIVGKTEEGDDVVLDPVLLSDSARAVSDEEDEEEE